MRRSGYLVASLGALLVCGVTVFGVCQQPPVASEGGIATNAMQRGDSHQDPRQLHMRQTLDANHSIVPWLLEQTTTGDDHERATARQALYALTPVAALELIEALANQNPEVRRTAMSFLPQCAESEGFPLNKAIDALLKIAQDENEDEAFRRQAKLTVSQFICANQGVTILTPPAAPA